MTIEAADAAELATEILAAGDLANSIDPITSRSPGFDLADAYAVSRIIVERRVARGELPVGWKIGFTNETIWDEYDVRAPIWGPMYSTTCSVTEAAGSALAIDGLVEPRIEPEIALRIVSAPHPDMEEAELFACIDAVAHGFEIVQSVFPGWRFKAADTVAAFALHGRYRYGLMIEIEPAGRAEWLEKLAAFDVRLFRDGEEAGRGAAANVLGGGPLTALRHFVRGLREFSPFWTIRPGDIITTGTVTRAFPIAAGERWSTEVDGLPAPGMDINFT